MHPMTMPQQNPSTSKQTYETPSDFLAAVAKRFGELHVDLACGLCEQLDLTRVDTRKAPIGLCWPEVDSLTVPWAERYGSLRNWLNPTYKNLAEWFAKCAIESRSFVGEGLILVLTPASVGANYFADHVHNKALVLALNPRITFVGETDPYPKDCMLSVYGPSVTPGFDVWRWTDRVQLPDRPHRRRRIPIEVDDE